MARQGWLAPVRLAAGPGYRLTPRGERRMLQAADRVYHHAPLAWDGRWHVVIVHRVPERARRDRLRSALGFAGYACLDGTTWISPRPSTELDSLLAGERVRAERFFAIYEGDAARLAAKAWDIDGLGRAYTRWLALARDLTGQAASEGGPDGPDQRIFAIRSELVHEWRKFLFVDPGLPAELLPPQWPGTAAAEFFDASAARLLPAAARFVDRCLAGAR
jgi:phenylacetic acid degradation operon negative regulatory protein